MLKFLVLNLSLVLLANPSYILALDEEVIIADVARSNETLSQITPVSLYANNKEYRIFYHELNWHSALELCSSYNMILASITNGDDNAELMEELRRNNFLYSGTSFWLAGSDIGHQGHWTWLGNGRPILYLNWYPGEPNNAGGTEHCLELLPNGRWNDADCGFQKSVICENRCGLSDYQTTPGYV